MAGDWIKMRTTLDTDWRVIEMASDLGIPELHVVGCLWKLWTWADQHTIDGNAIRVTSVTLDRFTGVTGFANSLRKVGWLDGQDNDISFPRFSEHNGKTAKNRAESNKRVAKHRNANTVTNVTRKALPEKRREEKRRYIEKNKSRMAFESETFLAQWQRWTEYRQQKWDAGYSEIELDSVQMAIAAAFGPAGESEAVAALEYSIAHGAKNPILNGDHRKRDQLGRTGRPTKELI